MLARNTSKTSLLSITLTRDLEQTHITSAIPCKPGQTAMRQAGRNAHNRRSGDALPPVRMDTNCDWKTLLP